MHLYNCICCIFLNEYTLVLVNDSTWIPISSYSASKVDLEENLSSEEFDPLPSFWRDPRGSDLKGGPVSKGYDPLASFQRDPSRTDLKGNLVPEGLAPLCSFRKV